MMRTLKTATLGCKVNQYETEYVREGLLGIGYRDAGRDEKADLCVVNTCTVTSASDSKSRQLIRRLSRENPGARIVVMGCYATRDPETIASLPGVAEVVTDKRELPDLLGRYGVTDIPTGISHFGGRSRAFVKIQDGCLLRCSYCIIPTVRSKPTSRPVDQILDEVRRLTENGYREIVLTGVHLGHFGVDWNWQRPKHEWTRLSHLIQAIAAVEGDFRIRLSSIEATEVTRELVQVMADHANKICPHLHICLQSGSDRILRRMKRRWGAKRLLDRCDLVRRVLDRPALTTDVVVGFPSETDKDFDQTCRVAREAGFSKIHVFPFSPRQGTPAAEMPEQIPKRIKVERRRQLAQLERELRQEYFEELVGSRLRVLVESHCDSDDGSFAGTSCRYAPVRLAAEPSTVGRLVDVQAQGVMQDQWIQAQTI